MLWRKRERRQSPQENKLIKKTNFQQIQQNKMVLVHENADKNLRNQLSYEPNLLNYKIEIWSD